MVGFLRFMALVLGLAGGLVYLPWPWSAMPCSPSTFEGDMINL